MNKYKIDVNIKVLSNYRRLAYINRYSTFPVLKPQSVAEHSFNVAILAYTLATEYNDYVNNHNSQFHPYDVENTLDTVNENHILKLALFHDMEECLISDIPHHIKHFSKDLEMSLKDVIIKKINILFEDSTLDNQKSLILENLDTVEHEIVKIADMLECAWFVYSEIECGNKYIAPLLNKAISILEKYSVNILSMSPTFGTIINKLSNYNSSLHLKEASFDNIGGDIND